MATRVDLKGILDALVTIFTDANTPGADPVYLSQDMTKTVQFIGKVHPMRIGIQISKYPFVTCYVTGKPIEREDIAKDQLSARRWAMVNIEVVGAVWNNNLKEIGTDPADQDCNYLMENVELALRKTPNLGQKCIFQRPSGVKYYDSINEQTHLRAGVMTLQAKVYY